MATGLTRSTVMAVVVETTEGTLKQPSASTDYLAMQEGFSVEAGFEAIENAELKSSIGVAKSIQGISRPVLSFDHYWRHSGVEGQAPNYAPVLKSAFGAQTTQSTERTLTTGSTTSVVNLAAGGSDYSRGAAILLKDAVNNYQIRPVDSISTNALTLGFNLAVAPLTGVTCGKFVNFAPANSAHQSLSVHFYNGNATSIEAVAGCKVVELSLEAPAGDLLNASYSLDGTKYFYNPIIILAADIYMDFNDGGGQENVSVTAQTYQTPHELAQALEDAMNGATTDNITVTYNDTGASAGKFTIVSDGGTLSLLWNTGTNTANTIGDKIGFSVAADDTGALTYTSDNVQSWVSPQTASFDTSDPLVGKANEVLIGDSTDVAGFCANNISVSFANTKSEVLCLGATSGIDSNFISGREITVSVSGVVDQHNADLVDRILNNSNVKFLYNFGVKSGGNWVAGKCGCVYMPTATVVTATTTDLDGVIGVEMELKAYVNDSGQGEFYVNFL